VLPRPPPDPEDDPLTSSTFRRESPASHSRGFVIKRMVS
jgi:hypothetical protein